MAEVEEVAQALRNLARGARIIGGVPLADRLTALACKLEGAIS